MDLVGSVRSARDAGGRAGRAGREGRDRPGRRSDDARHHEPAGEACLGRRAAHLRDADGARPEPQAGARAGRRVAQAGVAAGVGGRATPRRKDPQRRRLDPRGREVQPGVRPGLDDAVGVAALQNGEVDVAVNIPPHLAAIIDKHPKIFLSTAPSIRTIQLMFYTHQYDKDNKLVGSYQGPTADKRIRQAIASAIDVDEIIKGVLDGKGQRVATMLPSFHFGYDPSLKPPRQDQARTKKLLAEAGFPSGLELKIGRA